MVYVWRIHYCVHTVRHCTLPSARCKQFVHSTTSIGCKDLRIILPSRSRLQSFLCPHVPIKMLFAILLITAYTQAVPLTGTVRTSVFDQVGETLQEHFELKARELKWGLSVNEWSDVECEVMWSVVMWSVVMWREVIWSVKWCGV